MSRLPLFPLGLVAFPDEKLNLHIFEPRYKQLVMECHAEDKTFGIPPVIDSKPISIGTEMRIVDISHIYADGKMDIKSVGVNKFYLNEFHAIADEKLYPEGEVDIIVDKNATDIILQSRVVNLIEQLYTIMKMDIPVPIVSNDFRIYTIAHKIGLNMEQEIELLKIHSEIGRLEYVENHLVDFIPVVLEMENLRKKIQMNGHFKNVIPPDIKL
jgi:ATP-dependent Lon protease